MLIFLLLWGFFLHSPSRDVVASHSYFTLLKCAVIKFTHWSLSTPILYGSDAVDPLVTLVYQEGQETELLAVGCCFDRHCFWWFDYRQSRFNGAGSLRVWVVIHEPWAGDLSKVHSTSHPNAPETGPSLPLPTCPCAFLLITPSVLVFPSPPCSFLNHGLTHVVPVGWPWRLCRAVTAGSSIRSPVPVINLPKIPELHIWWMNLRDWLLKVVVLSPIRAYEGEWLIWRALNGQWYLKGC